MFGIEAGTQKTLDRLKKGQTLEQIEDAVVAAKKAGIEIVHGFFVVGSPDETAEDIRQTFRFASKLRVDSFGFNRLCVYRGTPLWKEYVERGLVDDVKDWYKYFKCSEIDPTVLPGEEIHKNPLRGHPATHPLQADPLPDPVGETAQALHEPHARARRPAPAGQALPRQEVRRDEGRGRVASGR